MIKYSIIGNRPIVNMVRRKNAFLIKTIAHGARTSGAPVDKLQLSGKAPSPRDTCRGRRPRRPGGRRLRIRISFRRIQTNSRAGRPGGRPLQTGNCRQGPCTTTPVILSEQSESKDLRTFDALKGRIGAKILRLRSAQDDKFGGMAKTKDSRQGGSLYSFIKRMISSTLQSRASHSASSVFVLICFPCLIRYRVFAENPCL